MEYKYNIFYNDGSFKERGTGDLSSLERLIPPEILKLVSSLEETNLNKNINVSATTESFSVTINSITKV
ncbi:hypothetical protein [Aquimarina algiphila]|uniref:Uncharacterized protein n=1 Tax=Aquimarina algiphila TaxID=2047982 RepID=A0A554VHI8_9FLAO|nr:hypothetical protein [Aquimarina algiphila]TSE06965.1 hypothetical protein FOF46_17225 [Aquimarina algiphila]